MGGLYGSAYLRAFSLEPLMGEDVGPLPPLPLRPPDCKGSTLSLLAADGVGELTGEDMEEALSRSEGCLLDVS